MDVTHLLMEALEFGASDVYLSDEDGVSVRKDGSVISFKEGLVIDVGGWLASILSPTQWETVQQTGDLDAGFQTEQHRFRLNIALAQRKWNVVARPLPFGRFSYEELGLPNAIKPFAQHRSGSVLVTGATGSGKSTTLAAMIHIGAK